MKVGIDARGAIWYRGTGIGTYTYQLLHHLKQRPEKDSYRLFWPGEEYVSLDIGNRKDFCEVEGEDNYWEQSYLPKAIAKEKLDLYHVPQNGIGLPLVKKCRQVVTIHDLIPYVYPETAGKKYLQAFLNDMPRIVATCDRIITVSQCSKKDIMHIFGYPEEKIDVIAEAPEPFYRLLSKDTAKKKLAEKFGLTGEYVLYVGGFGPRKNVRGLLIAFALAQKELPLGCKLVLPGKFSKDADPAEGLISALKLEDKVVFPGFVAPEELPCFYRAASLFVYPSFYEGFGLPPLEAMACGTPVLCSNTSSLPEVVGDGAALINPFDTVAIAEKIHYLLANREAAAALAERGIKRAKQFTWARTAAHTAEVYRKCCEVES